MPNHLVLNAQAAESIRNPTSSTAFEPGAGRVLRRRVHTRRFCDRDTPFDPSLSTQVASDEGVDKDFHSQIEQVATLATAPLAKEAQVPSAGDAISDAANSAFSLGAALALDAAKPKFRRLLLKSACQQEARTSETQQVVLEKHARTLGPAESFAGVCSGLVVPLQWCRRSPRLPRLRRPRASVFVNIDEGSSSEAIFSGSDESWEESGSQRQRGSRSRLRLAGGRDVRPPHKRRRGGVAAGAERRRRSLRNSNLSEDDQDSAGFGSQEELDGEEALDAQSGSDGDLSDDSDIDWNVGCVAPGASQAIAPLGGSNIWLDASQSADAAAGGISGLPALQQGELGFNAYAQEQVRKAIQEMRATACTKVEEKCARAESDERCPPLQAHQEVVACLLHPRSPVKRLLVDQPIGAGKTREMIAVLDQLFHDRRPKIPVFPRNTVCRNFYEELLRWPSRYRDFFSCMQPRLAAVAAGLSSDSDWRSRRRDRWALLGDGVTESQLRLIVSEFREVLEMKTTIVQGRFRRGFRAAFRERFPDCPLPGAPLRALSYASAGGGYTKIGDDGQPVSSLLKIGYMGDGLVFSRKIVLLDEAHNLARTQTQYASQLQELLRQLFEAKSSVIVGFTGTPILDDPAGGRRLLDAFKGQQAIERGCRDEGFLVTLTGKRPPLFPVAKPLGVPDFPLTPRLQSLLCRKVVLQGEALKTYILKKMTLSLPQRRLQPYCNVATHCCAFHGRRKEDLLSRAVEGMPKLAAIAASICRRREKAVVLISTQGGYAAMLSLLERQGEQASPPFCVASGENLADFNSPSNSRGSQYLVLVADANQFSEGVSFFAVRRLYIADVPGSASLFQQQCGRVSRMFGHGNLPVEERKVRVVMPIATLPSWMRKPLGVWAFCACCRPTTEPREATRTSRSLLRRLNAVRIRSLKDLKHKVDDAAKGEEKLSKEAATDLMKSWGLRPPEEHVQQNVPKDVAALAQFSRSVLLALQRLRVFASAQELVSACATDTADEDALRELAAQLDAQAPALAELRALGINCDDMDPQLHGNSETRARSRRMDEEKERASDGGSSSCSEWRASDLDESGMGAVLPDEDIVVGDGGSARRAAAKLQMSTGISDLFATPLSAFACFSSLRKAEADAESVPSSPLSQLRERTRQRRFHQ
eukprot:TRINITY_DN13440_c0_g1_i1.p1 TRINITY_DN13440_c0_g1~~TRINITY_DN13440_c0_g1_i1.p1  ORF type:complete len:1158 (+),score=216.61 TRINITY_DN13440_c0_g1_i1:185-3658(+)